MRKAVITGVGVICSIGGDTGHYWDGLSRGVCGIGDVTLFDTSRYRGRPGAQVKDEYFRTMSGPERRLSRCDELGLIAYNEAISASGIDIADLRPERVSVVIGSGSGGLFSAEKFKRAHINGGKARPSLLVPFSSSSFTDLIASRCNGRGVRTTISTACSSSSTAIGFAGDLIKNDTADIVITGGSESLSETTFAGFNSLRSVDEFPCRPFDKDRKGISLGEGAAVFVVEEANDALARDARIYAEIAGYGISGDAYHVTAPEPGGEGVAIAMETAFRDSGLDKKDIDYINAHGTGTQANDLAETTAIKNTFGERAYAVPVSSTKSMIGHCLGAAGALEAAASILPFTRGIIPPTANYKNKDPLCDLDYVPSPRKTSINAVVSLSLAFGGNNTALILRKYP